MRHPRGIFRKLKCLQQFLHLNRARSTRNTTTVLESTACVALWYDRAKPLSGSCRSTLEQKNLVGEVIDDRKLRSIAEAEGKFCNSWLEKKNKGDCRTYCQPLRAAWRRLQSVRGARGSIADVAWDRRGSEEPCRFHSWHCCREIAACQGCINCQMIGAVVETSPDSCISSSKTSWQKLNPAADTRWSNHLERWPIIVTVLRCSRRSWSTKWEPNLFNSRA